MQTIIAISLLIVATAFLGWNFLGKKLVKSPNDSESCGPDCKCS